jgi:hypothetical protein
MKATVNSYNVLCSTVSISIILALPIAMIAWIQMGTSQSDTWKGSKSSAWWCPFARSPLLPMFASTALIWMHHFGQVYLHSIEFMVYRISHQWNPHPHFGQLRREISNIGHSLRDFTNIQPMTPMTIPFSWIMIFACSKKAVGVTNRNRAS